MNLEKAWIAGRHQEGLAWCVQQLKRTLRPSPVHLRYALEFALELGEEDSLLSQFPDLPRSESPEVQALYSQVCWQRGQLQPALETAQHAYRQSPSFLTAYCLATVTALRSTREAERWLRDALRLAEGAGLPQRAVQAAAGYALLQVSLGVYAQAEVWARWGLRAAEEAGLNSPALLSSLSMASEYAQLLSGTIGAPPTLYETQPETGLLRGDFLLAQGQAQAALEAYNLTDDRLAPVRARRLPILARKVRALLELNRLDEAQRLGLEALALSQDTVDGFREWGELAYLLPRSVSAPSKAVEPLANLLGRFLARPSAPRAAMAALHLARAYLALGMTGKARATLAAAAWALEGLSPGGRAFLAGPTSTFQEVFALIQPVPEIRLHFLGGNAAWFRASRLALSPRHQEILAALALHPGGLSAEGLAAWVWGEGGTPETARAELRRLRRRLPLQSRPYRLPGEVWADFIALRERLLQGDLAGALALYAGPLLPGSDSPGVLDAREQVSAHLKTALLAQDSPQAAFELALQEDDPEFWESVLARLSAADPRRALLETRLARFLSR